ncbi:hypothetical protein CDIK_1645 [Cucumispora dikerogammari]|nr:hypothetical protein CDIK_1645 [Cucumispora dikerogammari]
MTQINLKRFIYTLYHSTTFDLNLLKRIEIELTNNNNPYILENIMNYLIKMLEFQCKNSKNPDFNILNTNKLSKIINSCLIKLNTENQKIYLIHIAYLSKSLFNLVNENSDFLINKQILFGLYGQIIFCNENNYSFSNENKHIISDENKHIISDENKHIISDENKESFINENDVININKENKNNFSQFEIMKYFPNCFILFFNDLTYKSSKLTIDILKTLPYKLHLNYLIYLINTKTKNGDPTKYINPLYNSYFIIINQLININQITILDNDFLKLNNLKNLLKTSLNILFKRIVKSKSLKTFIILKKYKKFYIFLDDVIIKKILINIENLKKVNINVVYIYEKILNILMNNNKIKVFMKILKFLEKFKITDLILELQFHYMVMIYVKTKDKNMENLCENLCVKIFQSVKKKISIDLENKNILKIFLKTFNQLVITDLNRIFLCGKIFNNQKSISDFINELVLYRNVVIESLISSEGVNENRNIHSEPLASSEGTNKYEYEYVNEYENNKMTVIEINTYLKNLILYLIYTNKIENIIEIINITLNPKNILKPGTKNPALNFINENFLHSIIIIIKHNQKINKNQVFPEDKTLIFFKYKFLWESPVPRHLLLVLYKMIHKTNLIEKIQLNFKEINFETFFDLQFIGNKEILNYGLHLYDNFECKCLNINLEKNKKFLFDNFFQNFFLNFLFFNEKMNRNLFIKYINGEKIKSKCISVDLSINIDGNFLKTVTITEQNLLFLLENNKYLISSFLLKIIMKFPGINFSSLILQLKLEKLILFNEFLNDLISNQIEISLFNTKQSFEIILGQKPIFITYTNYINVSKLNSFILRFKRLKLKDFVVENSIILSLKSILMESDAKRFFEIFIFGDKKVFFNCKEFFYFFILCTLKFMDLIYGYEKVVFSSLFNSCLFFELEIEDFF